jgi:hypothetical protein
MLARAFFSSTTAAPRFASSRAPHRRPQRRHSIPTAVSLGIPVLTIACASHALADVTLLSADRSVTARASNTGAPADALTDSLTGLGPYDRVIQREMQSYQAPAGTMQRGYAEQHSLITTQGVSFSGLVAGTDNVLTMGAGNGSGESLLSLDFALSAPTPWTCTFTDNFTPTSMSQASMALVDSSGALITSRNAIFQSSPCAGVLAPGSYRLTLRAANGWAGVGAGTAAGSYNWTFAFDVPSPSTAALAALACCGLLRRRR